MHHFKCSNYSLNCNESVPCASSCFLITGASNTGGGGGAGGTHPHDPYYNIFLLTINTVQFRRNSLKSV